MHTLYHPPIPSSCLLPDEPASASPSDHIGSLLVPRTVSGVSSSRICKTLTIRPFTSSQLSALGRWIASESWDHINALDDVDTQLESFTSSMFLMLNTVAPEKQIKIALNDPPWINTRIKSVIRQRNREYDKNFKPEKWKKLSKK